MTHKDARTSRPRANKWLHEKAIRCPASPQPDPYLAPPCAKPRRWSCHHHILSILMISMIILMIIMIFIPGPASARNDNNSGTIINIQLI